MKKFCLVGVDKDGTINEDRGYFGKEENWKGQLKIYPHVIEGLVALRSHSIFKIVVASNQAGVARGYFDLARVEEVNREIARRLELEGVVLDGWYSCPFVDEEYARKRSIPLDSLWVKKTDTRKPGTGMLKQASTNLGLRLEDLEVYFIGDKRIDVETGLNAQGKGILINRGGKECEKVREMLENQEYRGMVFIADNFLEAVKIILKDSKTLTQG